MKSKGCIHTVAYNFIIMKFTEQSGRKSHNKENKTSVSAGLTLSVFLSQRVNISIACTIPLVGNSYDLQNWPHWKIKYPANYPATMEIPEVTESAKQTFIQPANVPNTSYIVI